MEWLLIIILIALITLSDSDATNASESLFIKNYVTPSKTIGCSDDQDPCLTLQEYASQSGTYFTNNTIFYFQPGSHQLTSSLKLVNLHNFAFQGIPDQCKAANILFISITWEKCSNIEVSFVNFILLDYYDFSIIFEQTQTVQLHNISITGNGYFGCSAITSKQSDVGIKNSKFVGLQGSFGAALRISESCVTFAGNNTFTDNTALIGGSLYMFESVVILTGINTFMNNSCLNRFRISYCIINPWDYDFMGCGGAIYSISSTIIINSEYSESIFANNLAQKSGGAIATLDTNIIIQGSSSFERNVAIENEGGAISVSVTTLILSGNISFINNNGRVGGALSLYVTDLFFIEEIMSPESFDNAAINLCWNAALNGGFWSRNYNNKNIMHSRHTFKGIADFDAKTAFEYDSFNKRNLSGMNAVRFSGNKAEYGGAIRNYKSKIKVYGNAYFENNRAFEGGAMYFLGISKLILAPAINVSFILNYANSKGGAIYVEDSQCSLGSTIPIECFLSIHSDNNAIRNISLLFLNNSARSIGSTLYGGQLSKCRLYYRTDYNIDECGNEACNDYSDDALKTFMNLSTIVCNESGLATNNISSQAEKIKFCQGEKILNINDLYYNIKLHPGEQFTVSVIALGQTDSPVPTTVFSQNQYTGDQCYLGPSSHLILNSSCTNITFKLFTVEENSRHGWTEFKLYPDNSCQSSADGLSIYIKIVACPLGFHLLDGRCTCNDKIQKFTQKCKIDDLMIIERTKNNFWISLKNADILIINEYRCPLDYCKDTSLNVSLHDPSVQCDLHRNGTLCGQCQNNFSLALGSLHCISCDNNHTALILPFALAGIALIAVIFLLRLTVSVGTLNGLFFYANIIQANHQAYFPRAEINFFTIFIAWLNLNFGIESCFYDGMDIYAYSWLQFLFPFYLLFLVGCIILACHYSRSIAKRFGQNPVAVLATLLLMSYSKILNAIIVPLTWTYLTYYTASNETRSVV